MVAFTSLIALKSRGGSGGKFSKFSSGLDFSDSRPANFSIPLTPPPKALAEKAAERKNAREQGRLQGLMRSDTITSVAGERIGRAGVQDQWSRFTAWMVNEAEWCLGTREDATDALLGRCETDLRVGVRVPTRTGLYIRIHQYNLVNARATFSVTYPIARASALVLHLDVAFILLPVCRNLISFLRRGPLNGVVPFSKAIAFHKTVGWSIVVFTVVHIVSHMVNFALLANTASTTFGGKFVAFLAVNFTTGPGLTGCIMTATLGVMVWYSIEKRKKKSYEKFWYTHHLFIIFFVCWQLHGMFCMIKPDRAPYCSFESVGVFWKYWLVGGVIYIYERILREVRARHRTYISKVILHPSKVIEIQIKKEKTATRAGGYIFLNCPEVSYWQWHPFTLTSAPEEDYISVHIRIVGDFTAALAEALGCQVPSESNREIGAAVVPPPLNRVLPRLMIDGPFGSASEDVFNFEVSVLVGAGIGVTPFASVLKSIWYRLNMPQGKTTRLRKVYFFWICRDYESFEWFQSLLMAIEEQDLDNYIEIHTYLTTKVSESDINNIVTNDVGGERDAVTNLRAPTHYGRPNWDRIFQSVADKHPATEAGVFFCGPKPLGSVLHKQCNKWTDGSELGTKFFWGKESF